MKVLAPTVLAGFLCVAVARAQSPSPPEPTPSAPAAATPAATPQATSAATPQATPVTTPQATPTATPPTSSAPRGAETGSLDLDIETAMSMAEKASFLARTNSFLREEAELRRSQTLRSAGPSLTADVTAAWNAKNPRNELLADSGDPRASDRNVTGTLTLAQPIVGLGALLLKVEADTLAADIARANEQQSQKDARFTGAEAYSRALKSEQLLSIARAALGVVEKQRRDAEALFQSGRLNKADVLRLDLAVSDSKAQLAQAESTRALAFLSLAETVGVPDTTVLKLRSSDQSEWEQRKQNAPEYSEALRVALERRADVANAGRQVEIAEFYNVAGKLDYVPSLNAFVRYQYDFLAKDTAVPDQKALLGQLWSAPPPPPGQSRGPFPTKAYGKNDINDSLSYGLNLNWKIWDWGARSARNSELAVALDRARVGQNASLSRVRVEVAQALLEFRAGLETLESARSSVRFAEEAYRLTNLKFQSGTATTVELVTAERDQTRARGGLVTSRGDVDLAWLKLQRALGNAPSFKSQ